MSRHTNNSDIHNDPHDAGNEWPDSGHDTEEARRRRDGRCQHSHRRARPVFRHNRPRPRVADGECGLRLLGVDGHCTGPKQVSVGNGHGLNRRGCTEHAAQTLVRRPAWFIAGGSPRARAELEAHMRAVGSWRREMGGRD